MIIYYDSIQEGYWFQELDNHLDKSELRPFPPLSEQKGMLKEILAYDRPDIVLVDGDEPILVLERTIEVPSGHNVGQRFARLVAASQKQIPVVYFGPYAAYKHGGETQGPRYMNLRLFYALKNMAQIENSVITLINWPVDENYEIIQIPSIRDTHIKEYLKLFFNHYTTFGLNYIHSVISNSNFEARRGIERETFIESEVRNPEQYNDPPNSVDIMTKTFFNSIYDNPKNNLNCDEIVLYKIGMTYIRSDPYTGMAMLYSYLYCGGMDNRIKNLVLHFPNITKKMWQEKASNARIPKDIKLYRLAADGIIFKDGYSNADTL
ncbi:hypothetical protein ACFLZT_00560 [Thermodesulfobacteriota bacterium]